MTYQKSSINTAKNMFFYKFKGAIFFSGVQFLLLFLILPYNLISFISATNSQMAINNSKEKITDIYKYLLSENISTNIYLALLVIIFFSISLGIKQFKFFADKKTVNVFYSLGITRAKMYLSTYFSGALSLLLSVGIPVFISYFINLNTFGSSKELTIAFILILLSLIVVSLLIFTLTAVVFSMVGSLIEGIFYACFTIGFPTAVMFCLGVLSNKMLFGTTIFQSPSNYYSPTDSVMSEIMNGKFTILSPVLFPIRNILHYSGMTLNNKGAINSGFYNAEFMTTWVSPRYTSLIVWAVLCLVFALIGMVVFKRRKAEICGFIGVNNFLNFVLFSSIGLASIAFITLFELKVLNTIIIGLLVAIVATIIIIAVFAKISKLKFVRELAKIPLYLLPGIIVVIVFLTGIFGYSTKIPKVTDIKSISINSIGGSIFNFPEGSFTFGLPLLNFQDSSYNSISYEKLFKITEVNDIETIIDLHEKMISVGEVEPERNKENFENSVFSTDLIIKYTLKNGKVIERNYKAAGKKLLEEMLKINDTNSYKKHIFDLVNNPSDAVTLISNDLFTVNKLNVSEIEMAKLKENIAIDYQKKSALELAQPTEKQMGVIQFYPIYPIEKNPYDTHIFSISYSHSVAFPITETMNNTLNYLKELGYDKYLNNDEKLEIVSATLLPINSEKIAYNFYYNFAPISLSFSGSSFNKNPEFEKYAEDPSFSTETNAIVIKDKNMIQFLRNNSYSNYFTSKEGYFVIFTTKDESKSAMFIPTDKLPENILSAINKNKVE